MTDTDDEKRRRVTRLHCAMCGQPFSYIPSDDDLAPPDAPNLICDTCYLDNEEPTTA